jgi:uncharacterized protein (DUF1697 family)
MVRQIALLRAVNLAGHGAIGMARLRSFLADLGFADAQTLLQSGNAVFESPRIGDAALEQRLETEAEKQLGLRTAFFIRTAKEWRSLINENPFPEEAKVDPSHLVLFCLKAPPTPTAVSALHERIKGPEVVRPGARHVYITYPDGIGRSKLTNAIIEKALGSPGTGRNWNTVQKLAALACS